MVYWLFDPCIGCFRRFNNFGDLYKRYLDEFPDVRGYLRFNDWPCPYRDHSLKTISAFYKSFTGEVLLKSRYGEPRDLYRAAYRSGLMQRFFSGVKPVSTRRFYDSSSS